jgi:hypothetical protein
MFRPGSNIYIKPQFVKRVTRTYKVNSITPDGHYNLTELDYKTLKPVVDDDNNENTIIADKTYIDEQYQPLREGGRRRRTKKTKKSKKGKKKTKRRY